MDKNSLVMVAAVVLVASFAGALLGTYLVEKTGAPALPQMQGGAPPQGMPPQGGMPQQGGTAPQGGTGQNLCGDGTCDAFEKQNNVCPEDCKK